ncbi:MAG: hypothetical protein ABII10_00555 [Candidatus Paceibacterota bacterium]
MSSGKPENWPTSAEIQLIEESFMCTASDRWQIAKESGLPHAFLASINLDTDPWASTTILVHRIFSFYQNPNQQTRFVQALLASAQKAIDSKK